MDTGCPLLLSDSKGTIISRMFDSITPETIKEEAPPAGGQKECRIKAFDFSL